MSRMKSLVEPYSMVSHCNSGERGDRYATVLRIERSSIFDGEGLRTVVFLKGCPLRCLWCSTPESQHFQLERGHIKEKCKACGTCIRACPSEALHFEKKRLTYDKTRCGLCFTCHENCENGAIPRFGQSMSVEEVFSEIQKDEIFYYHSGGGVTLSGGECLSQAEFCADLLALCQRHGISTAVETSLHVPWRSLVSTLPLLSAIYIDIKHSDPEEHKRLTGVDNRLIMKNLVRLDGSGYGGDVHLRFPLIPGINDDDDQLRRLAGIVAPLSSILDIEILPYHRLGIGTYERLSLVCQLEYLPGPSDDYVKERGDVLRSFTEIPIHIGRIVGY